MSDLPDRIFPDGNFSSQIFLPSVTRTWGKILFNIGGFRDFFVILPEYEAGGGGA